MVLNEYGQAAHHQWEKLTERFTNTLLGLFQIMPNHIHGIIKIDESETNVGAGFTLALENDPRHERAGVNPAPTVGNIVSVYKSIVSKQCLEIFKTNCAGIVNYILANPSNWKDDMLYNP